MDWMDGVDITAGGCGARPPPAPIGISNVRVARAAVQTASIRRGLGATGWIGYISWIAWIGWIAWFGWIDWLGLGGMACRSWI